MSSAFLIQIKKGKQEKNVVQNKLRLEFSKKTYLIKRVFS